MHPGQTWEFAVVSDTITPSQIRGARAMLDWSMTDLSTAARVSVSTVQRAEERQPQAASNSARAAIQTALEVCGVKFLPDDGDGPGLRLKRR